MAREIHRRSSRAERPLIKVNCAAVPRELYESEFFGHVKGAFTGAMRDRAGRFELADGGTLLLDEVGEIPLELQGKLLRVLQEGEVERVGEERTRRFDVRILAATNRDLRREAEAGRFRRDLYFRLNVFSVDVAPLRRGPRTSRSWRSTSCGRRPCGTGGRHPRYGWWTSGGCRGTTGRATSRELRHVLERAVITGGNRLHLDLPVPDRTLPVDPVAPAPSEADRILTAGEVAASGAGEHPACPAGDARQDLRRGRHGQIAGPQAHHPLIPDQSTRYCRGAGLGASVTGSPHAGGRLAWRTYRQGRGSDGQTAIRPA